jgi:hypothetical protein
VWLLQFTICNIIHCTLLRFASIVMCVWSSVSENTQREQDRGAIVTYTIATVGRLGDTRGRGRGRKA